VIGRKWIWGPVGCAIFTFMQNLGKWFFKYYCSFLQCYALLEIHIIYVKKQIKCCPKKKKNSIKCIPKILHIRLWLHHISVYIYIMNGNIFCINKIPVMYHWILIFKRNQRFIIESYCVHGRALHCNLPPDEGSARLHRQTGQEDYSGRLDICLLLFFPLAWSNHHRSHHLQRATDRRDVYLQTFTQGVFGMFRTPLSI